MRPVIGSDDVADHVSCGKCPSCKACKSTGDCQSCGGEEQTRCYKCMGERTCSECNGACGRSCRRCDVARDAVADEANRLWSRDEKRGVTTGTKDLYIGFAVADYLDKRAAA